MPPIRLYVPALAIASILALAGCSAGAPGTSPETPAPPAEKPGTSAPATPIGQMSLAEKASIATSFPVQIPVPAGTLVEGNMQGPDAWDYTLTMEQPPADVAGWYESRMTTANWQLLGTTARDDGGFNLRFAKAAAESRVEIAPEGAGSRVVVSIGLGAPVLETQ